MASERTPQLQWRHPSLLYSLPNVAFRASYASPSFLPRHSGTAWMVLRNEYSVVRWRLGGSQEQKRPRENAGGKWLLDLQDNGHQIVGALFRPKLSTSCRTTAPAQPGDLVHTVPDVEVFPAWTDSEGRHGADAFVAPSNVPSPTHTLSPQTFSPSPRPPASLHHPRRLPRTDDGHELEDDDYSPMRCLERSRSGRRGMDCRGYDSAGGKRVMVSLERIDSSIHALTLSPSIPVAIFCYAHVWPSAYERERDSGKHWPSAGGGKGCRDEKDAALTKNPSLDDTCTLVAADHTNPCPTLSSTTVASSSTTQPVHSSSQTLQTRPLPRHHSHSPLGFYPSFSTCPANEDMDEQIWPRRRVWSYRTRFAVYGAREKEVSIVSVLVGEYRPYGLPLREGDAAQGEWTDMTVALMKIHPWYYYIVLVPTSHRDLCRSHLNLSLTLSSVLFLSNASSLSSSLTYIRSSSWLLLSPSPSLDISPSLVLVLLATTTSASTLPLLLPLSHSCLRAALTDFSRRFARHYSSAVAAYSTTSSSGSDGCRTGSVYQALNGDGAILCWVCYGRPLRGFRRMSGRPGPRYGAGGGVTLRVAGGAGRSRRIGWGEAAACGGRTNALYGNGVLGGATSNPTGHRLGEDAYTLVSCFPYFCPLRLCLHVSPLFAVALHRPICSPSPLIRLLSPHAFMYGKLQLNHLTQARPVFPHAVLLILWYISSVTPLALCRDRRDPAAIHIRRPQALGARQRFGFEDEP
ncbi:hypothetical protein C8F01DRAFT_1233329 [Mycena amicta]|nr:hypothetical protein C8F01DRAFT_1233329 [Mycena amicta]